MEKKVESLTIFEFQQLFQDNDACLSYLSQKKWQEGYKCP
jgi:hypothetical protein